MQGFLDGSMVNWFESSHAWTHGVEGSELKAARVIAAKVDATSALICKIGVQLISSGAVVLFCSTALRFATMASVRAVAGVFVFFWMSMHTLVSFITLMMIRKGLMVN
jgi:hypothetical protein